MTDSGGELAEAIKSDTIGLPDLGKNVEKLSDDVHAVRIGQDSR